MANMIFQVVKEADIATNTKSTEEGVVSFSERSIYLGLGNSKKVLYDGISPMNYFASVTSETEPATKKKGALWFKQSTSEFYACLDGTTFTLMNPKTSGSIEITGNLDGATFANPDGNY